MPNSVQTSEDHVKCETNCNVVFLEKNIFICIIIRLYAKIYFFHLRAGSFCFFGKILLRKLPILKGITCGQAEEKVTVYKSYGKLPLQQAYFHYFKLNANQNRYERYKRLINGKLPLQQAYFHHFKLNANQNRYERYKKLINSKLPNHLKYQILLYKKDPIVGLCICSVCPKPLFWFQSNTKTETQIGRYFWPIL